jgi:putative transposase
MIGNVNAMLHKKPGTTFSNPKHRGTYDSKGKASYTLHEAEQEIVDWIVNQYHQKKHSALTMPPIKKWELGIHGDGKSQIGVGLPQPPADPDKVKLDFMPFEMRAVRNDGIELKKEQYYHEVLNRWINSTHPDNKRRARKFIVRYDPNNRRHVWFWDPDAKQYFEIPCRDPERMTMGHEEYSAIKTRKHKAGAAMVDKGKVSASKKRSAEREEKAVQATKSAQRRNKAEGTRGTGTPTRSTVDEMTVPKVVPKVDSSNPFAQFEGVKVEPFDVRVRKK